MSGVRRPLLPLDPLLPEVVNTLSSPGATLVLQAAPGAGKTTRVPLALLESLPESFGTIWMLEPRRIAARMAAERLAREVGEPVGQRVGYSVRLESRTSALTRVELLTTGLFLRRLQVDPSLEGVGCVLFDEFHERSAEADLALALLRQARSLLAPELRLALMSATLDAGQLAGALPGARLLHSEGGCHPVAISHQRPREGERLEQQVVRALETHWLEHHPERDCQGSTALVFLPGQREIQVCRQAIARTGWGAGVPVETLHGDLPLDAQRRVLNQARDASGNVVLATAIAESSLTIPGVGLVIDAGLSRRARFDPASGLEGLITVPASQASAEQRAGRAGRLGPGRCVRLWGPAELQRRPRFDPPQILEADPLPLALQLAAWGDPLGETLPWIDPPPEGPLAEARELLGRFGALEPKGQLNPHGRQLARLGLHPRLGRMLLVAHRSGDLSLACELAVLLSERDPLIREGAGCDLLHRLDWLRLPGDDPLRQRLKRLQKQLWNQVQAVCPTTAQRQTPQPGAADSSAARLLAEAFPERVAMARPGQPGRFLMRSGRGAGVHPADPLAHASALAIASVDGEGREARVRLALALGAADLRELALSAGADWQQRIVWDESGGRVSREERLVLDALVLERRPMKLEGSVAGAAAQTAALICGIRAQGLSCLPWTRTAIQLRQRLALAHRLLGAPWPQSGEAALLERLEHWLAPHLDGLSSLRELESLNLVEALWGDAPWSLRAELDRLLPATLPLPSGRRAPLDYGAEPPVLAVKLQDLFGARTTPTLLNGQLDVCVHLLSPAGRPAAITTDLAGFWAHGYAEVRRELRGRYPKHSWPVDPASPQESSGPARKSASRSPKP